jgi:glycosyltransferase involved in cell wall biosynthesis
VELARAQARLGHRSAIWCLDLFPLTAEAARERSTGDHAIRIFPTSFPARLGYSRSMVRAAATRGGDTADVLHQHGLWRAFSRATQRWRTVHRGPTVVAPAGTLTDEALGYSRWRKKLALLAYEEANLRSASCLHANSTAEARGLRRRGLSNPIAVIPSGVPDAWLDGSGDAAAFRRRFSIPADRRLLLFLSRLHPIKGLPLLLEAVAALGARLDGWLLVLAGGDERGHLAAVQARVLELRIEDRVRFVGPLQGADKRNAFAAADLFVLPTLSESFGIVVAEALGAGVPVLTTRGAPWEELRSEGCGFHVEATPSAIGDGLRDAVRRPPEELRAMGAKGRRLVSRQYTWSRIAPRTVEVYEWLLGRRRRPDCVCPD